MRRGAPKSSAAWIAAWVAIHGVLLPHLGHGVHIADILPYLGRSVGRLQSFGSLGRDVVKLVVAVVTADDIGVGADTSHATFDHVYFG